MVLENKTFKIVQKILENLFVAEYRRLAKIIDKIHEQNKEALRVLCDGFSFQGKIYRHSMTPSGGGTFKSLHLDLWPTMEAYLADEKQVELDKQKIQQVLVRLIGSCHCDQHIRDAIPDCIADTLPERFHELERMGGPNFYTERDLRQYNAVLPKIEFYSAARLLY